MVFLKLQNINKLYFGYEDIASALDISLQAARVSANRYVKKGILLRIKRNVYILKDNWKYLDQNKLFSIANIIQTPSYVSLLSALCYYEISTQIQQNYIESIALKRTKKVEIENTLFNYSLINKNLYSGFIKKDDFFIALPEKAFLDSVYLFSLGKYALDFTSIDFTKFDKKVLSDLLSNYPVKTKNIVKDKYGNL
jgi:predicted transcriptional regulator of viral defense system